MVPSSERLTYTTMYGKFTARDATTRVLSQVILPDKPQSIMRLDSPHRLFTKRNSIPATYSHWNELDVGGMWYGASYVGKAEHIVLIKNHWTRNRVPTMDSCIPILLYPTAGFIEVKANIVPHVHSEFDSIPVFSGYGHVMDIDMLEDMGVEVPDRFARTLMDAGEFEEAWTIETLVKSADGPPEVRQVASEEGGQKTVVIPKKRRKRRMYTG